MKSQHKEQSFKHNYIFSDAYGYLGHLLYSERTLRGVSIQQVAKDLNLSTYIIHCMEQGHLNKHPGFAYMLGFVRTYATYLDLDAHELCASISDGTQSIFETETVVSVPFQQKQMPSNPILFGSIAATLALIVGYMFYGTTANEPSPLHHVKLDQDIQQSAANTPADDTALMNALNDFTKTYLAPSSDPPTEEAVNTTPSVYYVTIQGETWIALKDIQGNLVREGILHAGDRIELPLEFEGILHTGNAGGIQIEYPNTPPIKLGYSGQVIQNFPLNFKKNLAESHKDR